MKFEDLTFEKSTGTMGGKQATIFFFNGYGASVLCGDQYYTSSNAPYEIAVIQGDRENWGICYATPITDDVIGYQTADEISKLLAQIEALPNAGDSA